MIKLLGDLTTKQDEKDIMTVVSKEAVTMLEVEDNKVSDEDINFTTNLGTEVRLVCTSSGGRPEVFSFNWIFDNNTWTNVSFSSIQYCSNCNDPYCNRQNCRFDFIFKIPLIILNFTETAIRQSVLYHQCLVTM